MGRSPDDDSGMTRDRTRCHQSSAIARVGFVQDGETVASYAGMRTGNLLVDRIPD